MRHARTPFLIALCAVFVGGPVLAQPASPGVAEMDQVLAAIRPHAIRAQSEPGSFSGTGDVHPQEP